MLLCLRPHGEREGAHKTRSSKAVKEGRNGTKQSAVALLLAELLA